MVLGGLSVWLCGLCTMVDTRKWSKRKGNKKRTLEQKRIENALRQRKYRQQMTDEQKQVARRKNKLRGNGSRSECAKSAKRSRR